MRRFIGWGWEHIGYYPMNVSHYAHREHRLYYAFFMKKNGRRKAILLSYLPGKFSQEREIYKSKIGIVANWLYGGDFPEEFVPVSDIGSVGDMLRRIALKELEK